MSEENVEVVRRAYEAYGRRDIEELQSLCNDGCIVQTVVEGRAEPQPFRGLDGIREWIENERAVWASVRIDDLEIRDLGDDRLFTTAVAHVRGRESGIELELPVWSVIELHGKRLRRLRSFPDRESALEAAGLAE
jgi:ketosteroid isomerase-like protein